VAGFEVIMSGRFWGDHRGETSLVPSLWWLPVSAAPVCWRWPRLRARSQSVGDLRQGDWCQRGSAKFPDDR